MHRLKAIASAWQVWKWKGEKKPKQNMEQWFSGDFSYAAAYENFGIF